MGPSSWRSCPFTVLLTDQRPAGACLCPRGSQPSSQPSQLPAPEPRDGNLLPHAAPPTPPQSPVLSQSLGVHAPRQAATSSPDPEPKYEAAGVSSVLPPPRQLMSGSVQFSPLSLGPASVPELPCLPPQCLAPWLHRHLPSLQAHRLLSSCPDWKLQVCITAQHLLCLRDPLTPPFQTRLPFLVLAPPPSFCETRSSFAVTQPSVKAQLRHLPSL